MIHQIKITFAILALLFICQASSAHGPEKHKKEGQQEAVTDSMIQSQDSTIGEDLAAHEHEGQIMPSTIVKARLSDFPTLHPLLVHFPIVFLLLAFLTQFLALFVWKKEFSLLTGILLLGGFGGAYLVSMFFHPHTGELSEAAQQVLGLHDRYADYTIWISGIALLLKAVSHFLLKRKLWMEILVVAAIAGAAWSVSHAGHYGATLVHLHGVGPQGKYLETQEQEHEH